MDDIDRLTKNTAFLYAKHGLRVNAVAPGPVETGMNPNFRSAIAAERLPAIFQASISRVAQPEEIAATIAWILSEKACALNGAIIAADGGWSAA
ncbi:UNVERIFIED_ORG: NAD(P)-dependent dehydrogenase (short-subunit alcohol dehydrogenase family) [Sphingomonas sp. R1F5B]